MITTLLDDLYQYFSINDKGMFLDVKIVHHRRKTVMLLVDTLKP